MSKHLNRFTPAALQATLETRQTRADERAANVAPSYRCASGSRRNQFAGIAAALNARGVRTPLGHRHWYASQVASLLARLAE
jgi:hypothetical protein